MVLRACRGHDPEVRCFDPSAKVKAHRTANVTMSPKGSFGGDTQRRHMFSSKPPLHRPKSPRIRRRLRLSTLERLDHSAQPLAFTLKGGDPGARVLGLVEGVLVQGGAAPAAFEPEGELDRGGRGRRRRSAAGCAGSDRGGGRFSCAARAGRRAAKITAAGARWKGQGRAWRDLLEDRQAMEPVLQCKCPSVALQEAPCPALLLSLCQMGLHRRQSRKKHKP